MLVRLFKFDILVVLHKVYGAANSNFGKTNYVSGAVTLNFIESCFPFLMYSIEAVALTQTVVRDVNMFN